VIPDGLSLMLNRSAISVLLALGHQRRTSRWGHNPRIPSLRQRIAMDEREHGLAEPLPRRFVLEQDVLRESADELGAECRWPSAALRQSESPRRLAREAPGSGPAPQRATLIIPRAGEL
jgi:hypothetical protein